MNSNHTFLKPGKRKEKRMDTYSSIFTRASTRKFDSAPLSAQALEDFETFITGVKPLVPEVKLTHKIVGADGVKGLALPKAPHYLLISGREHPLRNTAAGFCFQQAELYLYSRGYATRWLNSVSPRQPDSNFIIGIALGKPSEPAVRKPGDFDRRPLEDISSGTDSRLEAARLAPSGMNGQPWYFAASGGVIHVYYRPSLGGIKGRLYHLTDLDVGIALAHLKAAGDHEGKSFRFTVNQSSAPTPPKGFAYVGTVE